MSAQSIAPIIIKRKKVVEGGGHHGGAWKVAYADFVTAMMAFFLLMWLLGATNEKQRKGIADYFNPTIPVNKVSGGGSGAFGGDSILTQNTLFANGSGGGIAPGSDMSGLKSGSSEDDASDGEDKLAEIAEKLSGLSGESMVSDLLRRHVVTRLTDEGLIVEVFDIPGTPLFDASETPTRVLAEVVDAIAQVFQLSSNPVAVQAHTARVPVVMKVNPVWERSSDRADAVRRLLTGSGIPEDRMQRVTGFADRKPVSGDTMAVRNNRIEIILLRHRF